MKFGGNWTLGGFEKQIMACAARCTLLDGINEKELRVFDLAIETDEVTNQNTGFPDLATVSAIRLLLNRAVSIDAAIVRLKQYGMHVSAGMVSQLALSDASGRSVVMEYLGQQMTVTEMPLVTSFYLAQGNHYRISAEQSKDRYQKPTVLLKTSPVLSSEQRRKSLSPSAVLR